MKSGVSPQKLRKNSSCSRILGRRKHQFGSLRPRFVLHYPESVNFFGAQFSLGMAQFLFGGHGHGMLFRRAGPALMRLWARNLLSKKCRSGGEPLPIRPAHDLNLRPPAP